MTTRSNKLPLRSSTRRSNNTTNRLSYESSTDKSDNSNMTQRRMLQNSGNNDIRFINNEEVRF